MANLKRIIPKLLEWTFEEGENYEQLEELYEEVLEQSRCLQFVETFPQEDGTRDWLTSKFPIVDGLGRVLVAGMGIDITDARRAQADKEADSRGYYFPGNRAELPGEQFCFNARNRAACCIH